MYVRFTPKMRLCRAYGCFPDAQVRVLFLEEGEGPFWAQSPGTELSRHERLPSR